MTASTIPGMNTIKVASGKGGVGKTWFSVTLANTLSYRGENVLLFDGDLGLANVDVQLGLTPGRDLGSVINGTCTLEEAVTRFLGNSEGRGGFSILAGKSGSGALGALNRSELQRIRQGVILLSGHYDRTIIDLAAGIDPSVTTLCGTRGTTIVVLSNEPTSLTDAYAFIKVLTMRDPSADIRIVVNMARDKTEGKRTYGALLRACESFLGLRPPLIGIIPVDPMVPDAIRHQTALLTRHPQSRAAQAVEQIAKNLVASQQAPSGHFSAAG